MRSVVKMTPHIRPLSPAAMKFSLIVLSNGSHLCWGRVLEAWRDRGYDAQIGLGV